MVNSMTGFGSSQGQGGGYRWTLEIRSVNGRGLDIRARVPDGVDGFEKMIRDRIPKVAARGNVSIGMRLHRDDDAQTFGIDPEKVRAALAGISEVEHIASELGRTLVDVKATDILALRGVMESGRDQGVAKETLEIMRVDFETALKEWTDMRAVEGASVASVMTDQVNEVARLTKQAEAAAGSRLERMKASLQTALQAITESAKGIDPARVEAELAIIAVKADITEEIDRLNTHVQAALDLLSTKGPIGRKLDFLTQEFNREANTLCSKAQSSELTAIGLDLKAVIDQMREQVQNVE